ncbi:MAG: polyprenyl synthetase family protein [Planctomycetales bacterium]|nr:polyprenyl synthetase family protein [Planctomycetales bacterium]
MSQVVNGHEQTRAAVRGLYAPIAKEMVQVEELLARELRSEHPFVDELVRHGFRYGGKRLRPALLLLSAQAVGRVTEEHLTLAAVVEMIHTATLIHDDVLDEAELRRHLDTINARYSNESSVLLGDYLFTHSFYLASTLETTFACRTIGQATNIVCEGELRQIHHRGNLHLAETEYLAIIDAKTAELTACSCRLGAHYAGADEQLEEQLSRYGRNLGIAFQIVDDLLDLLGDESTVGKSLGTDMEKGKATLPIIRALGTLAQNDRDDFLAVFDLPPAARRAELLARLEATDALEYTREKARWYVEQAIADLARLPASEARDILQSLAEFVLAREL